MLPLDSTVVFVVVVVAVAAGLSGCAAGVASVVIVDDFVAPGAAVDVVEVVTGAASLTGVISVVGSGIGLLITVATKVSMPSVLPS